MRRRAFLVTAVATAAGLAGCAGAVGRRRRDGGPVTDSRSDHSGTPLWSDERATGGPNGLDLPVSASDLPRSVPRDDIPAITDCAVR